MSYAHTAPCTFKVASWSGSAYVDIDGEGTTAAERSCPKRGLSKAEVSYAYTGDEVVPGMGTGGLETLVGEAERTIAGHSEDGYDLVLSYDLG